MKRKLLRLASKPPDWQYAMINIWFHRFEILKWYNIRFCTVGLYSWNAIILNKYTYNNNKYIDYLFKASLILTHNVFFADENLFLTATNIKQLSQMINKILEKIFAWLNTITAGDFAEILAHLRGELAIWSLPNPLKLSAFALFSWTFVWR